MTSKNKSVLEDTNKTAVQQLVDRLKRDIGFFNSLLKEQGYVEMRISTMAKISQTEHILKYAEKMLEEEKEQAFKFWNGGIECTEEGGKSFEQYYNQTYEK
jgi:di/tripeptidase